MNQAPIKDLLGIESLDLDTIHLFLDRGRKYLKAMNSGQKKYDLLKNKTVVNLFYEPSTRTRSSFEMAAKRLGADIINISADASSSVIKGESLVDTAQTLAAMDLDFLVLRHESAGTPQLLAKKLAIPVINAGDGFHEHPTQALLDALTIQEHYKRIEGLRVTIVGDIAHSRVARSNIYLLKKLNAKITVCGPPTLLPSCMEKLGVDVEYNLEPAVQDADVVMMLRLQSERQNINYMPRNKEYHRFFGLHKGSEKFLKKSAIIMHPGPINRGVEISPEIADGENSVILHQVSNGVAVRMGVLDILNEFSNKKEARS